jgi:hypothetical protein
VAENSTLEKGGRHWFNMYDKNGIKGTVHPDWNGMYSNLMQQKKPRLG